MTCHMGHPWFCPPDLFKLGTPPALTERSSCLSLFAVVCFFFRFFAVLLFSIVACIIQRKLPKIRRENIKWTVLAAGLDFSYTVILYTHFINYVPLGAIGSLTNGTDIVLATLCVCLCRKIVPSLLTAIGVFFAILGICFTLYPALYPVFHPDSELEYNSSNDFPNITRKSYLYENGHRVNVSIFKHTTPISGQVYEKGNSSYAVLHRFTSSNTVRGVLTVIADSVPCTLLLMTLSGPLKEENSFALNFWFGLISTPIALATSCVIETPVIPNNTRDVLMCCLYAATAAMVNFTETIAMKFISPVLYDVVYAMNVPLMLLVEHLILSVGTDGGKLEIIGASIVFVVGAGLPVVEYLCVNRE